MFVRIVSEPLKQIDILVAGTLDNRLLFLFTTVAFITLLIALVQAVAPGIQMVFDGTDEVKKAARTDRYFSLTQKKERDSNVD